MFKGERGASLAEIMFALIIFGAGITMVLRVLPNSSHKVTKSRNVTVAMNLAQEKLEELMSLPFDDFDLDDGDHADPGNPIDDHYERSWTIVADDPIQDMKRVTVTVHFPSGGADSVRSLQTFISSKW